MPKKVYPTPMVLLLTLSLCLQARAQRMFFNTYSDVYEITGTPGNYSYNDLGHYCVVGNIENIAMHGDTLYLMTTANEFYSVLISTGACQYLNTWAPPGIVLSPNNLTCDENGLLYFIAANILYRYDPHSGKYVELGNVPVYPDGDMLFYNGMLLCSANGDEIWNIDISDPPNSTMFMDTSPFGFWGLYAVPNNCQQNRLYGLDGAARIVEIDPQKKTIKGLVTQLPNGIFPLDGASMAEDGIVKGVIFDSLAVLSPCGNNTFGSIQAFASSAPDGGTSYTLDGTLTNTTGIFDHVPTGTHTIHIQATPTCTSDSVFTLNHGLTTVDYQVSPPPDCAHLSAGQITATANTEALPVNYTINGTSQTSPVFAHLDTGTYVLSIVDAGHCEKDTTISLAMQHVLPFPATLTIAAAYCQKPDGSLTLERNAGVYENNFSAMLNGSTAPTGPIFSGLTAGTYSLRLENTPNCIYDTVIVIPGLSDPTPVIQATVQDQHCFTDNGSISLSITGADGPYLGSINGGPLTAAPELDSLAPGTYTYHIQDVHLCSWDTSFIVHPYPMDSVHVSVDQVDPICTELNSGALTITMEGEQAPYWLQSGNSTLASGSSITQLAPGDLTLPVINRDGCIVDSIHAHLKLEIKPECNMIYLPNAFSPNGDGNNDLFQVIKNPYMAEPRLRVFNRYGALMFTSSDQYPAWDGRFHDEPQPAGIYVWEVDYIDLEKTPRTAHGTLLLIR